MNDLSRALIAGVVVLVVGGSAYVWWQERQAVALPPLAAATPAPVANEAAASAVAPLHYGVEAITPPLAASPLPPLTDSGSDLRAALVDLLGRQQVLSFLDVSDFPRRLAATVDNFARAHAASRLWPVLPAPGRFSVSERGGVTYMADANADRYKPFVRFVSAIDTDAAVALYVRMYPLLQQAYVSLGYPEQYFNNRVVEVIDVLLATPELHGPLPVTITDVRGPHEMQRPWVRYEYVDATLEARPAGQKMLLRMGPENARQLKAKLRDFRQRVAGGDVGR